MNRILKLSFYGLLVILLLALALPVAAEPGCPPQNKVYFGGPVTNAAAVKGSRDNPATTINEAWNICNECRAGGFIWEYQATTQKYIGRGSCGQEIAEQTGAPLAQTVLLGLLGLMAVGGLTWSLWTRRRLSHS